MKIIKYLADNGWIPLYLDEIRSALFAEKNLSDLTDKEAARENLELSGDNVHSHYHDDRYLPLLQKLEDKLTNQIDSLKEEVKEKDILEKYDGSIGGFTNLKNGWYKWTGELDGIYSTWIILKTDALYTATNMADPRIVLRSNDLSSWYSSYAYWHA